MLFFSLWIGGTAYKVYSASILRVTISGQGKDAAEKLVLRLTDQWKRPTSIHRFCLTRHGTLLALIRDRRRAGMQLAGPRRLVDDVSLIRIQVGKRSFEFSRTQVLGKWRTARDPWSNEEGGVLDVPSDMADAIAGSRRPHVGNLLRFPPDLRLFLDWQSTLLPALCASLLVFCLLTRSIPFWPAHVGLTCLALLIGTLAVCRGPAVSNDSVTYFAASESLLAGGGFVSPWGAYVHWPPLFPMLLAGLGGLGIRSAAAAAFINTGALAALAFIIGGHLWRVTRLRSLSLAATAGVVGSVPLLSTSIHARSEMVFILLVVGSLQNIGRYTQTGSYARLLVAMLLAALCCLQRYVGVILVAAAIISLLVTRRQSLRRRFLTAVVFGLVATTPLALWLVRNFAVSGKLTGARHGSLQTFGENAELAARTILRFLGGHDVKLAICLVAPMILIFGVSALWWCKYPLKGSTRKFLHAMIPHGVFLILYVSFMVALATVVYFSPLGTRMLSPAYPCILICAVLGLASARQSYLETGWRRWRALWWSFSCWGILMLSLSFGRAVALGLDRARFGGGVYGQPFWTSSPTIRWVRSCSLHLPLYSNAPAPLYFFCHLPAEAVTVDPTFQSGHVVWFAHVQSTVDYRFLPERELVNKHDLVKVREFADGCVYRILSDRRF